MKKMILTLLLFSVTVTTLFAQYETEEKEKENMRGYTAGPGLTEHPACFEQRSGLFQGVNWDCG